MGHIDFISDLTANKHTSGESLVWRNIFYVGVIEPDNSLLVKCFQIILADRYGISTTTGSIMLA